MRKIKIIFGIIASSVVIAGVVFFALRYLVTKSFPQYSGTITVSGLRHQVTVARDEFGVPHISADNDYDMFFAQGYVHAQDRLWQMDIARRAGEGRLSEVLGSSTIKFDKMLRTIGFSEIARKLEQRISPKSKEILQAYADGVNEFIRTHRGKYPVEFDMLNYEPEEWKPVHSLMISRLMAWELNISWHVDIVLGELVAKLGEAKAQQVFPTYPENAPVIVDHKMTASSMSGLNNFVSVETEFREFFGTTGTHIGSNAWAVSPEHSEDGSAMLASDPHLGLGLPAKWYEIHLKSETFDAAGVSLPGTPLIIIGHNHDVAWGLTNVMADDADFYLEQIDPTGADMYSYKGEEKAIEIIQDTIVVKDTSSVPFTIKKTIHGPAVNEIYPLETISQSNFITMRWTGFEMSDELYGIYLINTSHDWASFLSGVKQFTVPGQNFVYADRNGNIGFHPGVRLPMRRNQNPTLPSNGWNGENEWTGFVPFDELPSLYNPREGYIATANNKTSSSFPYHISNLWEPPSRIQRIRQLLQSKEKFSAADFKMFQNDYYSQFAKDVVPFILDSYAGETVRDERVVTMLTYFKNWNFMMTKDDVPTAIFEVFFNHLVKNIFYDEMGDDLYRQYIVLANIPYRVVPALLSDTSSVWFDDVNTPSVETKNDIIHKSMNETLEDLTGRFGSEMKEWQWGKLHSLTLRHPFSTVGVLRSVFSIGPYEVGGSGTTVNNGEYHLGEPYEMTLGPSTRQIVDFADINTSLSVIPSGQSGQPFHDHFSDQSVIWRNGEYHRLPLDDRFVAERTKNILYLIPDHQ